MKEPLGEHTEIELDVSTVIPWQLNPNNKLQYVQIIVIMTILCCIVCNTMYRIHCSKVYESKL